ncbi:MAG: DegV family protein [Acutalibacteraceae bacterium]|jgi:DegV family protein with EDD domain
MNKTLIITDTSSDIPIEYLEQDEFNVLSMIFNINGKPFCEGVDFTHENFYEIIPKREVISSFQIPAAIYIDRFRLAQKAGYENVLVITSDSQTSPMFSSAIEGRGMFLEQNPDSKLNIQIFDSMTYSMGTGLIVLEAAKLAKSGESIDTIISVINDLAKSIQLIVNSFSIRNLRADAPLDWIKKMANEITHPFPTFNIIESDAIELPIVKGDHTAFDQFFGYCYEALIKNKPPYAIGYAMRAKEARAIAILLEEELGYPPVAIYKVGAFSTYCAGRAAITLAFVGDNRKE